MSGLVEAVLSTAFVTQAVRVAVPYACAATGGAITERSGVIDLAIEAKLLFGAFGAAVVAHATGSVWAGLVGGMTAGVAVAMVQLVLGALIAADQVVVGVALNLGAYGLTRYLLQVLYGSSANSPQTVGVGSAVWTSPVFWLAAAAVTAVAWALTRTAPGLRIRAAGDRPAALAAAGVSVARTRAVALAVGGALAGLGGAQLALANHGFSAEMSNGRGYLALAIVILGGWRPAVVAITCLGLGLVEAFAYQVQLELQTRAAAGHGPSDLEQLTGMLAHVLPYLLTLAFLALLPQRARTPRALGRADDAL